MHEHRRPTTTALSLLAVFFFFFLAVSTIGRISTFGALLGPGALARLGRRSGATLLTVRLGRLPVPAVGGGADRRRVGRGLWSVPAPSLFSGGVREPFVTIDLALDTA